MKLQGSADPSVALLIPLQHGSKQASPTNTLSLAQGRKGFA